MLKRRCQVPISPFQGRTSSIAARDRRTSSRIARRRTTGSSPASYMSALPLIAGRLGRKAERTHQHRLACADAFTRARSRSLAAQKCHSSSRLRRIAELPWHRDHMAGCGLESRCRALLVAVRAARRRLSRSM